MKIKTIFWDFDGVLINSNRIRDQGFWQVLKDFPAEQVEKLMAYHHKNGGLSRYVKFRYFFEVILNKSVTNETIQEYAKRFSEIMLNLLVNKDLLIPETVSYVMEHHKNFNMHIVSGSDGEELRQICSGIGISQYFKSIEGSPTPKRKLVSEILLKENYDTKTCIMIGDSINDFDAANANSIGFYAFNNPSLLKYSNFYFDNIIKL
ncbi:HAD family hydrolase [Peijinzhouia sedimentorum]